MNDDQLARRRGRMRAARRFRGARGAFLKNVWLTLAVVLLSLIRMLQFHEGLLPMLVTVVSIVIIWMDDHVVNHRSASVLLSMSIIFQVIFYQEQLGLSMTLTLGGLGLIVVWWRDMGKLSHPKHAKTLNVPPPVREGVSQAAAAAKATAKNAAKSLAEPLKLGGPSSISRGKSRER